MRGLPTEPKPRANAARRRWAKGAQRLAQIEVAVRRLLPTLRFLHLSNSPIRLRPEGGLRRTCALPAEALAKVGRQRSAARALRFSGAGRRPFPFFLLPRTQGKWSAGRRRVRCDPHPGEPCEGPPRALRGRAHPSDVGVRRLPALHLRRCGRGHVLPSPAAPLRPGFRRSDGASSARRQAVFMICSLGMMSRGRATKSTAERRGVQGQRGSSSIRRRPAARSRYVDGWLRRLRGRCRPHFENEKVIRLLNERAVALLEEAEAGVV